MSAGERPANNLNQVANVAGRPVPIAWSLAGNMATDGKGTTFVHDGLQRLLKATKADGTTLDYAYSTDGLRVETVKNATGLDPRGMPTGGTRVRYVLSGSEEIADLDANRNIIARYIPGAGIDERVMQVDAVGNIVFIHNDKQNSVIAISGINGAVTQRRGYGVYGETNSAQMTSHPFGYTGRRWDSDLSLYYYRARWYDPTLGTFLETDPVGANDYVNVYAYVGLEPGNGVDPTGEYVGVDDLAVAGSGAILGLGGQLLGDALSLKASSWQTYAGAAVGGAVAAEVTYYATTGTAGVGAVPGYMAGGALGGAASKATERLLSGQRVSLRGQDGLLRAGGIGAVTNIPGGAAVRGITAGRGSMAAVARQIQTSAGRGQITRVTAQTGGKIFAAGVVGGGNGVRASAASTAADRYCSTWRGGCHR